MPMTAMFMNNPVRYRYLLSALLWYLPLAVGLGFSAWRAGTLPWELRLTCIALGLGSWTCIEYLMHRFLFHVRTRLTTVQGVIERLHLGHHWEPQDEAKITVPIYGSLPIAAALLGLYRLTLGSWEVAGLLMSGTIVGYLYYELVHFQIHRGARSGFWLSGQRRHHLFHHSKDPERCFGVTTPLWDWVFVTGRARPRQTLPGSFAGR
jgi:sterol desaturase/sphingolipid hydroxylase (fatty acid hydroxylase superfamily)